MYPPSTEPNPEPRPEPSFVVGPDGAGQWLAVETHGLGGGIFVSQDAALHYARSESCRRPGAVEITLRMIALR